MAARVLIVDSISANRILLKVKLAGAFAHVEQAASAGEALDLLETEVTPDLLVLGGDLVDMSAIDLCAHIKERAKLANLPVLLVNTDGHRADLIDALRVGADDAFDMSVSTDALLARIRSIVRARNSYEELRAREQTAHIPGLAEPLAGFETPASVLIAGRNDTEGARWQAQLSKMAPFVLRHQRTSEIMHSIGQSSAPD
ncbi:MAG: response regulator, partial [Shimia sp.]|uniref:response regulator n=1 Tax=Shimia sp. TaxID=1954381 RepID=UPI001B2B1F82